VLQRFDADVGQDRAKGVGEEWIAIVDEMPAISPRRPERIFLALAARRFLCRSVKRGRWP
jgi:hypothetical protein